MENNTRKKRKDIIVKTRNCVSMKKNKQFLNREGKTCRTKDIEIYGLIEWERYYRDCNGLLCYNAVNHQKCYTISKVVFSPTFSSLLSSARLRLRLCHQIPSLSHHYLTHQDDWNFSSKQAENGWISEVAINDLWNVCQWLCFKQQLC